MKGIGRLIEVGEVWGIKMNKNPDASWFDICLILGTSDSSGNCVALSMTSGKFVHDFSHGGMPRDDEMDGWERIL